MAERGIEVTYKPRLIVPATATSISSRSSKTRAGPNRSIEARRTGYHGSDLFSGQPLWMVFGRSLTLAPYASVNCPPAGTWHPFVLGT